MNKIKQDIIIIQQKIRIKADILLSTF